MDTINKIIADYTNGKNPVEKTNAALKEAGAGFSFQPGKNALTAEEIAATKVGARPGDVTGYGLMSSGTPVVEGASVEATIVKNGKGKKIRIFKYNPKKGYRKRQGHRQPYTKVEIQKISV